MMSKRMAIFWVICWIMFGRCWNAEHLPLLYHEWSFARKPSRTVWISLSSMAV